jgi:hypothetical protein
MARRFAIILEMDGTAKSVGNIFMLKEKKNSGYSSWRKLRYVGGFGFDKIRVRRQNLGVSFSLGC